VQPSVHVYMFTCVSAGEVCKASARPPRTPHPSNNAKRGLVKAGKLLIGGAPGAREINYALFWGFAAAGAHLLVLLERGKGREQQGAADASGARQQHGTCRGLEGQGERTAGFRV
jgi:hypothetical protein